MPAICPVISPDVGFVRAMITFVDCQAQSLGAQGYLALLAPGSTLFFVLTGFLTLFVALFGYRLLMGHVPDVREGVLTLAKLGFVMALATSWPAYRTLVYDVALRGPAELTAEIGVPSGIPGAGGGLVDRLDTVDQGLAALAVLGAGEQPLTVGPNATPDQNSQSALPTPPPPFAGFNAFALGSARLVFLLGAVGSLAAVRLVAGLMLALGPFFIAFLLFEQTRGLFEGWVRVLAGAALAAVGTAIALGLELALAEPWLADILTRRAAGEAMPNVPAEVLLVTAVFALILLAMLYGSARVAFGFRLAPSWRAAAVRIASSLHAEAAPAAAFATAPTAPAPAAEGRTRAATVVDAISNTTRREAAQGGPAAAFTHPYSSEGRPPAHVRGGRDLPDRAAPPPLGQSFRRSTRTRVSASARRRDRTS